MEQYLMQEQDNVEFDVSYLKNIPVVYEPLFEKGIEGRTEYFRFEDGGIVDLKIKLDNSYFGTGSNAYEVIENAIEKGDVHLLELSLHEAYHAFDAIYRISSNDKKQREGFAVVNAKLSKNYTKLLKNLNHTPTVEEVFNISEKAIPYLLKETQHELLVDYFFLPKYICKEYIKPALNLAVKYESQCRQNSCSFLGRRYQGQFD